ncbi:MAG: DUF1844 domain-containing protein [Candidatus Omnitrophica bacterium]|nr:DUF1844 domain-containing protein [Candidatus Omnitrophota bacterium]
MNEEVRKRVDEEWKAQVDKEKTQAQKDEAVYHQPTFTIFLSSLGMQAMIALGKLENPLTGKADKNMEQARFLIDTMTILKEKTKGNLSAEEEKMLEEAVYNLQLLYVQEKNARS